MRVLVADRLSESSLDEMRTLGVEVSYEPELEAAELPARLADINVLIVRGTEVNKAAFDAGSALNLVIRAGAGVKNIDVATASERGIYVANCPGKNASAVAELTFALIGSLDRRIPDGVASMRAGRWEKHEFARAVGLRGRSLGILGLGHVGRAVLKIAQAYELNCFAWSRSLTAARAAELGVTRVASPLDLARVSDIFSVHLELTERTRGIVDRNVLSQLKPGAFFINASILVLAATVFFGKQSVTVSGQTYVFDDNTDWIRVAFLTLAPLLGTFLASILFAVALLASGQSSTITGTLAGQVVMEGFMRWRMTPWIRRLVTRLLAIIPAIFVIGVRGSGSVNDLLVLSQVVLALQLPFAMFPLLHFTSREKFMGKWKLGWFLLIAGWTSAVLITAMDIYGLPGALHDVWAIIRGE